MPEKALIYATSERGLLVFEEPEFPQVPLQIPGGTIGQNENPKDAAKREFLEETGLKPPNDIRFLGKIEWQMPNSPSQPRITRHFFHMNLPQKLPKTWDHFEENANDGSPPILFRFSWLSIEEAFKKLGGGLNASLAQIEPFD